LVGAGRSEGRVVVPAQGRWQGWVSTGRLKRADGVGRVCRVGCCWGCSVGVTHRVPTIPAAAAACLRRLFGGYWYHSAATRLLLLHCTTSTAVLRRLLVDHAEPDGYCGCCYAARVPKRREVSAALGRPRPRERVAVVVGNPLLLWLLLHYCGCCTVVQLHPFVVIIAVLLRLFRHCTLRCPNCPFLVVG
jgi:hypothetical protein